MLPEILTLLLALTGLGLFALGLRRIWRWRLLAGGLTGGAGILLITLALLFASLTANLYTYQRLTHENTIARLRFENIAPRRFRAYLTTPDQTTRIADLYGDEWQLDARILKFHGLATLIGLDNRYRLERLQSRWHDPATARRIPPSIHSLAPEQGLDLWQLAHQHPDWLPWVDAYYGSAVFLPMAHNAVFRISLGQSGLVARPENAAARAAVENW